MLIEKYQLFKKNLILKTQFNLVRHHSLMRKLEKNEN